MLHPAGNPRCREHGIDVALRQGSGDPADLRPEFLSPGLLPSIDSVAFVAPRCVETVTSRPQRGTRSRGRRLICQC